MRALEIEKEKTHQIMLSYRREEIMDLIQSVNRRIDVGESQADASTSTTASKKEQSPAELSFKRDKMQDELNTIEEQLFELEKKYGEARPRRSKKQE